MSNWNQLYGSRAVLAGLHRYIPGFCILRALHRGNVLTVAAMTRVPVLETTASPNSAERKQNQPLLKTVPTILHSIARNFCITVVMSLNVVRLRLATMIAAPTRDPTT